MSRFTGTIILLIVAFVLSSFAVSAQTVTYCSDSDGGQVYNVFGRINYSYASVPGPGDWVQRSDVCISGYSQVSSCTGASCYVSENYCTPTLQQSCSSGGVGPPTCYNYYTYAIGSTNQLCTSQGYAGCTGGACTGALASCTDGTKNGAETDVDCGGTCSDCANGKTCATSADCQSAYCASGVCQSTDVCSNGIQDDDEDGVDCGGDCSTPCSDLTVTAGEKTPGDHSWQPGEDVYNVMLQLKLQVQGKKLIEVKQIGMKYSGDGTATGVEKVIVAIDANSDGVYLPYVDTLVGERAWPDGDNEMYVSIQPAFEMDPTVDDIKYLLVVYKMKQAPVAGQYQLVVNKVLGDIDDESFSKSVAFSVYKTVGAGVALPGDNCYNDVKDFDELGVDCGGAYCPACAGHCANGVQDSDESGVDCGGGCPTCSTPRVHCPNGVQDGDETGVDCGGSDCPVCGCPTVPGCNPNSPPVCDDATETASICISGFLTPVDGLYETQCGVPPEESCMPGTSVCFEGTVTLCSPMGFWSPAIDDAYLWSQYCENDACAGQEDFCTPTGMAYSCSNGEYMYQGPCAASTECNPGEILCDNAEYSFQRCDASGHWATLASANMAVVGVQDGFFDYCAQDVPECNPGATQCEISEEEYAFHYCEEDGRWATTRDPAQVQNNCFQAECLYGETFCDAELLEYRVCNANGEWLTNPASSTPPPAGGYSGAGAGENRPIADDAGNRESESVFASAQLKRNAYLQAATGAIFISDPAAYEENCVADPGQECVPGEQHCEFFEGDSSYWSCNEFGFWSMDETVPGENCGGLAAASGCNEGDSICDDELQQFSVCDGGEYFPIVGGYEQACVEGLPPADDVIVPLPECEGSERQCNFDLEREELCVDEHWAPIEQSDEDYAASCAKLECNPGWFACNPADDRVQFCQNGQWGPEQEDLFDELCEPQGATFGGVSEDGGAFARGSDRVLVGDQVDGRVVVIRSIPAFPVRQPPAPDNAVVSALKELPWWLLALLAFFIAATFFSLAVHWRHLAHDKAEKKRKS